MGEPRCTSRSTSAAPTSPDRCSHEPRGTVDLPRGNAGGLECFWPALRRLRSASSPPGCVGWHRPSREPMPTQATALAGSSDRRRGCAGRRARLGGARQRAGRGTNHDHGSGRWLKLLQGAGCNVLALAGPEGALMIDGGLAANADALLAAVRSATGASRIHTLINTHGHAEQIGANEAVGRAGGVIFAHEKTQKYLSNSVESVMFKGRRKAAAAGGPAHQDHARRGLDGVRRPADRLRLSARGAHRRRPLSALPEDESAGGRRRRFRGNVAAPRLPERRLAGRPRPRACSASPTS